MASIVWQQKMKMRVWGRGERERERCGGGKRSRDGRQAFKKSRFPPAREKERRGKVRYFFQPPQFFPSSCFMKTFPIGQFWCGSCLIGWGWWWPMGAGGPSRDLPSHWSRHGAAKGSCPMTLFLLGCDVSHDVWPYWYGAL